MRIEVQCDMAGALIKTAALRLIPRAFKYNVTAWAKYVYRDLQLHIKGTGGVFKRTPKEINSNLGFIVEPMGVDGAVVTIGTGGFVGKKEVVYARIQELGGDIKPKGHPYLTIPFPGVKGRAANYPNAFFLETRKGPFLVEPKGKNKLKFLFSLKQQVHLPPRWWFSTPIKRAMPSLQQLASPEGVMAQATLMAKKKLEG